MTTINFNPRFNDFLDSLNLGIIPIDIEDLKSSGYLKTTDKAYKGKIKYRFGESKYNSSIPIVTVINLKHDEKHVFNGYDIIKDDTISYLPVTTPGQQKKREARKKEGLIEQATIQAKLAHDIALIPSLSQEIPANFGYLLKKGLTPADIHGAYFCPANTLHGVYKQDRDCLLFPLRSVDSLKIKSYQVIFEDGFKLYPKHPDGIDTCFFYIEGNKTISICEGIATGYSIHKRTGNTVICAMNAGNLSKVTDFIVDIADCSTEKYAVELWCDYDQWKSANVGYEKAFQIAEKHDLTLVVPSFEGMEGIEGFKPTDFNDLDVLCDYSLFNSMAMPIEFDVQCIRLENLASLLIAANSSKLVSGYPDLIKSHVLAQFRAVINEKSVDEAIDVSLKYLPTSLNFKGTNTRLFDADKNALFNTLFIQSPMGTGKTTVVKAMLDIFHKQKKRTAYIVHRISLANSMASKLKIESYQDLSKEAAQKTQHLACCVNSIAKVDSRDVLIIDEFEQVLRHLTSNVVKSHYSVFQTFCNAIAEARIVVCLDAHLTQYEVDFVNNLRSKSGESILIRNMSEPKKGVPFDVYTQESVVFNKVIESVKAGKKVLCAYTSKEMAAKHHAYCVSNFPNKQWHLRTGDETGGELATEFDNNPNEECTKYDGIFYNSAIGSGVSIDDYPLVPDFQCFAFLSTDILTAHDSFQLISRYRRLSHWTVYIENGCRQYPTDAAQILFERAANDAHLRNFVINAINAALKADYPELSKDTPATDKPKIREFDKHFAHCLAKENNEKNDFMKQFLRLAELKGFAVTLHEKEEETDTTALEEAGELRYEAKVAKILGAKDLSDFEVEELKAGEEEGDILTPADKMGIEKNAISNFYCQPVSRDLIEMDNFGEMRRKIRNAELPLLPDEFLVSQSQLEFMETSVHIPDSKNPFETTLSTRKNLPLKKAVIETAYKLYGITVSDGKLTCEKPIVVTSDLDTVKIARDFVLANINAINGMDFVRVRKDFTEKPLRFFNSVIESSGIAIRTKSVKTERIKVQAYQVDIESLATVSEIVEIRQRLYWNSRLSTEYAELHPDTQEEKEARKEGVQNGGDNTFGEFIIYTDGVITSKKCANSDLDVLQKIRNYVLDHVKHMVLNTRAIAWRLDTTEDIVLSVVRNLNSVFVYESEGMMMIGENV